MPRTPERIDLATMVRTEKANPQHPPFVLIDPLNSSLVEMWRRKGYEFGECSESPVAEKVDFSCIPINALRTLANARDLPFSEETSKSELADALAELSWDDDPPQNDEVEDVPAVGNAPVSPQRPMSRSAKRAARNGG